MLLTLVTSHTPLSTLSLSLFSLTPPPPSSTLFPYTTLFRSRRPRPRHHRSSHRQGPPAHQRLAATCSAAGSRSGWRDRKSTRLNSSHEWISYAVFCLKKKKNLNNTINVTGRLASYNIKLGRV